MFVQSMVIMAALMFVLGLVAVAVWVAKKFGAVPSQQRSRVAIEVVQRVSIGPKTGLAVVRVGEKVMAVSMGPDGMRPLFELDEADRQRVVASSATPTPFASSADAALAKLMPAGLSRMFQKRTIEAPVSFANSMQNALSAAGAVVKSESAAALPEQVSAGDRDFRNMLNIAMSGATRLAVFGGVMLLGVASASSNVSAQTPPTTPVVITPVPPVANPPAVTPTSTEQNQQTTAQPAANGTVNGAANTQALQAPAPKPPVSTSPAFVTPPGGARTPRTANVRPAVTRAPQVGGVANGDGNGNGNAVSAPNTRASNTSSVVAQRPAAQRAAAQNIMPGTASRGAGRTQSAATAPVAGGDDAIAGMIPQMDIKMGDGKDGGLRLSGTVGIVVMMGIMTMIPTLVLMMTGFTRILIVLHFLKQAMGTQSAPPAQLLAAMALLLTGFVMAPTLADVNKHALTPWMDGQITQVDMLKEGVKPMRAFMLKQTDEKDLKTFIDLSRLPRPNTVNDVPLHVLTSSFVASELRRAFQIGFMVYLPFIIIDAVVASVLMSMGMFMLPPAMISMPFKLLLFVLVDGWGLIITQLVKSFK